ncbi:hypothetical protein JCM19045_3395 [Bacillus sp. JCM 19045]|nr:hypothetical protein JCM19045_3395 [Bacillus sp. JCM 19045]
MASCFLLSACQFSVSWGEIEEDDAVAEENPVEQAQQNQSNELEMPELQVTPYDQEVGITIENNEFYQLIAKMIENNPSIGTANDFYMTTVDVFENEDNEFPILFVAVNRIGDAIKNIDFTLDINTTDGEKFLITYRLIFQSK